MTGVFPAAATTHARIFMDVTDGHDTGLAILNDSDKPASANLRLYNIAGDAIETTVPVTLPARNQAAKFVSELFPGLRRGRRGLLEIMSDTPLQILALRSTTTTDRFLLAAFPTESLDIPRPERVLFFPHIVDGSGFSSEFFLTNLGAGASAAKL